MQNVRSNVVPIEAKPKDYREATVVSVIEEIINGNYLLNTEEDSSPVGQALHKLILKLHDSGNLNLDRLVKLSMCSNEASISSAKLLFDLRNIDQKAQSIATATREILTAIAEINLYSQDIKDANTDSIAMVHDVSSRLSKSVDEFETISKSVTENVKNIGEIGAFASEIRNIADDIKGISFQTNLLALNASVEAARAGPLGAGFSVVAQEMHQLSDRSTSATKQITNLVDSFEGKMETVVSSLESSTNSVQAGKSSIELVKDKMYEMKENIEHSSEKITNISVALERQSVVSSNIAKQNNQIALSTTKSVDEIDDVVDTLNHLQTLIDKSIVEINTLSLPNKVIKLAQSDHVVWKKRLVNMIYGKEVINEEELANHHTCRLGKWYDKVGKGDLKNNKLFKDLLAAHKALHVHGRRAAALYNQGDIADSLKAIEAVELASLEVFRLLKALEEVESAQPENIQCMSWHPEGLLR